MRLHGRDGPATLALRPEPFAGRRRRLASGPARRHRRPAMTPSPISLGRALDAALADLAAGPERLSVWSLVVTVFGDAVAPRGGVLRVAALQEIVARLGVEPGALRTALSRLARDGWLERERRGRASFHALTPRRRAELDAASRRIYAPGPPPWEGAWLLAALRPGAPKAELDAAARRLRAAGFARVSQALLLRPARPGEGPEAEAAPPGVSLFLSPPGAGAVAPELVAAAWPSETPAARFRDLAARIAPLAAAAERGAPDPLDALAARLLLVHLWRRAVLAAPDLPEALRPQDWPGETARAAARDLYWRLARPSELWLDACGGGPEGALPAPGPAFRRRFGGPSSAAAEPARATA